MSSLAPKGLENTGLLSSHTTEHNNSIITAQLTHTTTFPPQACHTHPKTASGNQTFNNTRHHTNPSLQIPPVTGRGKHNTDFTPNYKVLGHQTNTQAPPLVSPSCGE